MIKYGYVYIELNMVNGKWYIGKHKYSGDGIDEKYWGSGVEISKDRRIYGKDNFTNVRRCHLNSIAIGNRKSHQGLICEYYNQLNDTQSGDIIGNRNENLVSWNSTDSKPIVLTDVRWQ